MQAYLRSLENPIVELHHVLSIKEEEIVMSGMSPQIVRLPLTVATISSLSVTSLLAMDPNPSATNANQTNKVEPAPTLETQRPSQYPSNKSWIAAPAAP